MVGYCNMYECVHAIVSDMFPGYGMVWYRFTEKDKKEETCASLVEYVLPLLASVLILYIVYCVFAQCLSKQ